MLSTAFRSGGWGAAGLVNPYSDSINQLVTREGRRLVNNAADAYTNYLVNYKPGVVGHPRAPNTPTHIRMKRKFSGSQGGGGKRRRVVRKNKFSTPSTFQKDSVAVYAKRKVRKSLRSRRKAARFRRAVKAVIDSNIGLRSYSLKNTNNFSSAANSQAFYHFVTGTTNGDYTAHANDLYRVFNAALYGTVSSAVPNKQDQITYLNSTGQLTILADTLNTTPCYITFWRIICRSDVDEDDLSPTAVFLNGLAQNDSSVTGGSALSASAIATTPFISSEFCSHYLVTNVRRISLDPGVETVVTWNNKKRRNITWSDLSDTMSLKGVTVGYFIQMYGGIDAATGTRAGCKVFWEFIRTYNVKHSERSNQQVVDIS